MTRRKSKIKSAGDILDERFFQGKPEMVRLLAEEEANAEVAGLIYRARMKAGLTQQALAERVGTTKSVISRLEDADYRGHSLAMLRRIGEALGYRVRVRFEPIRGRVAQTIRRNRVRGRMSDRAKRSASQLEASIISEISESYTPRQKVAKAGAGNRTPGKTGKQSTRRTKGGA